MIKTLGWIFQWWNGDYVISDIVCACGKCLLCREDNDANCINFWIANKGDPNIAVITMNVTSEYTEDLRSICATGVFYIAK